MSRIGKIPVTIPDGVTIKLVGNSLDATGPKGSLSLKLHSEVKIRQEDNQLVVSKASDTPLASGQYGLARTLVANMLQGVSEGFSKQLEIHGVGYRAQVNASTLSLALGYSHPIDYKLPEGVTAVVEANIITISGIDKQLVGQVAAEVRALRKPEPYKGKGIRYAGEHVRRKAGKAAVKAGGA